MTVTVTQILEAAGMKPANAAALMALKPMERRRYQKGDEHANGWSELIGHGLAYNISSQFSGETLGVQLSNSGEIVRRLAAGLDGGL